MRKNILFTLGILTATLAPSSVGARVCLANFQCSAGSGTTVKCIDFIDESGLTYSQLQTECDTSANLSDIAGGDTFSLQSFSVDGNYENCAEYREENPDAEQCGVVPDIPPGRPDQSGTQQPTTATPATTLSREVSRLNPLEPFQGDSTRAAESEVTVTSIIARIANFSVGIVGSLGLVMYIYAGLNWMIRGSDPAGRKVSLDIIIWTSVGMIILLGSAILVDLVLDQFSATTSLIGR